MIITVTIGNIIIRSFLVIGLLAMKGAPSVAPEFLLRSSDAILTDTSFIPPWRPNPGLGVLFQFDSSEACTKFTWVLKLGVTLKTNNTMSLPKLEMSLRDYVPGGLCNVGLLVLHENSKRQLPFV